MRTRIIDYKSPVIRLLPIVLAVVFIGTSFQDCQSQNSTQRELASYMSNELDQEPESAPSDSLSEQMPSDSLEERNKAIARAFYEDLWFSNNTDRFSEYVADEYVVHDLGDRKNVVEPSEQQKEIADFFHSQGDMTGTIDYQIAEGDLVATRWQWKFQPTSLIFRLLGGRDQIPIINVFRFEDGKIVEIWNHRHDIDTARGNIPFVKGLGIGLLFAVFGWGIAVFQWRKRKAN